MAGGNITQKKNSATKTVLDNALKESHFLQQLDSGMCEKSANHHLLRQGSSSRYPSNANLPTPKTILRLKARGLPIPYLGL